MPGRYLWSVKMEKAEIKLQSKYAHTANQLLKQLRTKEITLKEYLMQCAYWAMRTLDDVYFKSLPSRPLEVISYEQLSPSKRNRLPQDYYRDHPEVPKYYKDKDRVLRSNKDNFYWLGEWKKHIPESDVKNHEKLDKKILDFKMKMEGV